MTQFAPDDTQPRRPAISQDIRPDDATPARGMPPVQADLMPPDEEGGTSPGCFLWVFIMGFTALLGLGVVLMAGLAGWSEGLGVARANATATSSADIDIQCQRIQLDIANGNLSLVQRRFEALNAIAPMTDCIALYAPTATAVYLDSLPTATPIPTETPPPTPTATPESAMTEEAPIVQPTTATTGTGFDLDSLLAEARQFMDDGDYMQAIDTLDAISAIDANYQKATVDSLLFNALTTEARNLYRSGTRLAEANLLVTRAEEFGDVGELNYERFIAQLYLEAQAYRNVNYTLAIRTLQQIVVTQGLTNYLDAQAQLINQHIRYADALALGGDACEAQRQYNSALGYGGITPPDTIAKRDQAAANCLGAVAPETTPDPNAPTPDPNAPTLPPVTPTIAPIGVPGT